MRVAWVEFDSKCGAPAIARCGAAICRACTRAVGDTRGRVSRLDYRLDRRAWCFHTPNAIGSGEHGARRGAARVGGRRWRDGCLRTYGWTTPTLSLGYFQRLAEVRVRSAFSIGSPGATVDGRRCDLASPRTDLRAGRCRPVIRWPVPARGFIRRCTRRSRMRCCAWGFAAARRGDDSRRMATGNDPYYALLTPIRKIS